MNNKIIRGIKMKQISRKEQSIKKFLCGKLLLLITNYDVICCKNLFIRLLNSDYLGINGLFANILTVLSLAELGVGTAIIYAMYTHCTE